MSEIEKINAFVAGFEAGAAWEHDDGHGEEVDGIEVIVAYLRWADGQSYVVLTETDFQAELRRARGEQQREDGLRG